MRSKKLNSAKPDLGHWNQKHHVPKLILSTREAAKAIGIGHNAVRDLVYAGVLKSLPGRNIRIPLVQIEQYIANNTALWIKK
jgi:excisionase family DNA binding protein